MPPHIHTIGGSMSGMTKTEAVQYAAEQGHRYVVYIPDEYAWATVQDTEELGVISRLYGVGSCVELTVKNVHGGES